MASIETTVVVASAVTMTAGAADVTSTAQTVEGGYGGIVNVVFTNGATGPTVAPQCQLQVSSSTAGSIWGNHFGPLVGGVANNGITRFSIPYEAGVKRIRSVTGSNTGQNVTVDVEASNVSAT